MTPPHKLPPPHIRGGWPDPMRRDPAPDAIVDRVPDDFGPSMEDILMVRASLSFAAQYQPKGMEAFDRILNAVDDLSNALERCLDDEAEADEYGD